MTTAISTNLVAKIVDLFHRETVLAKGCTEPIAIAFAAAKVKDLLGENPDSINITLSGNIIKNVNSVIVPNSGGMIGIPVAVAMGIIAGDVNQDLMVISDVTSKQMQEVKQYLDVCPIKIKQASNSLKLYIKIEAVSANQSVSVELKHYHTNFTEIIKNGEVVLKKDIADDDKSTDPAEFLTVRLVFDLAKAIDTGYIQERLEQIIKYNTAIAKEGLTHNYGACVGKNIQYSMEHGFYGNDVRNLCASVTAAASDARMGGSAMPVMTASGSGNVGITATLPIITYCQYNNLDTTTMYRGLFFSIMLSLHLKLSIGRLSAHCGPSIVAAALAGAIAFINDCTYETISQAISNTIASVAGAICDGANSSCALKIANAVYAAFDGAILAMRDCKVTAGDGVVAKVDVESTIRNIGKLARVGMKSTDEIILQIMTQSE